MKKNKILSLSIIASPLIGLTTGIVCSCSKSKEQLEDVTHGFSPTYEQCSKTSLDYEAASEEYISFALKHPDYINQEYKHYAGKKALAFAYGYHHNILVSYKTKLTNFKVVNETNRIVSYQINKELIFNYATEETVGQATITSTISVNNLQLDVFVSNSGSENGVLEWFVSPSALNCDLTSDKWSLSSSTKVHRDIYVEGQKISDDKNYDFVFNKDSQSLTKEKLKLVPLVAGWSSYYLQPVSFSGEISSKITSETNNVYSYNFAHIKSGQPLTLQFTLDEAHSLQDFVKPTLIGYTNINGYYLPTAINPSLTIVSMEMINNKLLQVQFDWDRYIRPEYEHISRSADVFNVVLSTDKWTYVSQDFIPIEKSHAYDIYHTLDEKYAILDTNAGASIDFKIYIDEYLAKFLIDERQSGCQHCSIKLDIDYEGSVDPILAGWSVEYDSTAQQNYLVLSIRMSTTEVTDPGFVSNPFDVCIYYNNEETSDETTIILKNYKLRYGEDKGFMFLGDSKLINFNNEPQILKFSYDGDETLEDIELSCFDGSIQIKPLSVRNHVITASVTCDNLGLYTSKRVQLKTSQGKTFICSGFTFNNLNGDLVTYTGNGDFYLNKNQPTNYIFIPISNTVNEYAGAFKVKLSDDLADKLDIVSVNLDGFLTETGGSRSFLKIGINGADLLEVKTYSGSITVTYEDAIELSWQHDINFNIEDCPYEIEAGSIQPQHEVTEKEPLQITCVSVASTFEPTITDLKLIDMEGNELNYALSYEIEELPQVKVISFDAKGNINDKLGTYQNCQLEFALNGQKYHINTINILRNSSYIHEQEADWNISLSTLNTSKTCTRKLELNNQYTYVVQNFEIKLLDEQGNEISGITTTPTIEEDGEFKYLSLKFSVDDQTTSIGYKKGSIYISYKDSGVEQWRYDISASFEYVNTLPFQILFEDEYDYKEKHAYGDFYVVDTKKNTTEFDVNRLSYTVTATELTPEEEAEGWITTELFVEFSLTDDKMYMFNRQPELEQGDKLMTHYVIKLTYVDAVGNALWTYSYNVTAKCNLKD